MNILRYNALDELFKGFWVKPVAFPVENQPERKVRDPQAKQEKKEKHGESMRRGRAI